MSRKHLALEVLVTLAENASGMVRKNASKYIPLIVPQILAMMVDLDDDPEWSIQDEIEDEDEERYNKNFEFNKFSSHLSKKTNTLSF